MWDWGPQPGLLSYKVNFLAAPKTSPVNFSYLKQSPPSGLKKFQGIRWSQPGMEDTSSIHYAPHNSAQLSVPDPFWL